MFALFIGSSINEMISITFDCPYSLHYWELIAWFQMLFIPLILPHNTKTLDLLHATVHNPKNPYHYCAYCCPFKYTHARTHTVKPIYQWLYRLVDMLILLLLTNSLTHSQHQSNTNLLMSTVVRCKKKKKKFQLSAKCGSAEGHTVVISAALRHANTYRFTEALWPAL